MGYSNYKNLKQVTLKFGLTVRKTNLFPSISPVEPSDWLKSSLEYAYLTPLLNEKVKSEQLISPVLTEVHRLHLEKLSLFSGEELNIKPEDDLNEACDFFFSLVPDAYLLEAPNCNLSRGKGRKFRLRNWSMYGSDDRSTDF